MPKTASSTPSTCTPKSLPNHMVVPAAAMAIKVSPHNSPSHMLMLPSMPRPTPFDLAVVTSKYWHSGGVNLIVGFLDNPPLALRAKILQHMNSWNKTAVVSFRETADMSQAQVRISRGEGGYWSYIGTDILLVNNPTEQTMNLESFTMNTPDQEFFRVVRPATGHTLGCPHEHMRSELVELIDPTKAIAYYGETQGWTADQVRNQVLTPYDPNQLIGTAHSDSNSIMCYQIPGALTKNGQPILGGTDIDASDYAFIAKIYPKPVTPPGSKPAPESKMASAIDENTSAPLDANMQESEAPLANGTENGPVHRASQASELDKPSGASERSATGHSPANDVVRLTMPDGVELSFSAQMPEALIKRLLKATKVVG